jgi:Tol biopolymer transport system component
LAKEPTRRFQSALDLRNELAEPKAEMSSGELRERAPAHRPSVNTWLAAFAAALLMALGAVLFYLMQPKSADIRLVNAIRVTSAVGVEDHPTWSPGGDRVAYEANSSRTASNWDIWIAQLGGGDPVNLTPDHEGPDRFPSWAPDGRQIAFLSKRDEIWSLYTMSCIGGNPRRLLSLPTATETNTAGSASPQWSEDGSEIAVPIIDSGKNYLEIVSLETREARRIELAEHAGNLILNLSWESKTNMIAYVTANHASAMERQLWVDSLSKNNAIAVTNVLSNNRSPSGQ